MPGGFFSTEQRRFAGIPSSTPNILDAAGERRGFPDEQSPACGDAALDGICRIASDDSYQQRPLSQSDAMVRVRAGVVCRVARSAAVQSFTDRAITGGFLDSDDSAGISSSIEHKERCGGDDVDVSAGILDIVAGHAFAVADSPCHLDRPRVWSTGADERNGFNFQFSAGNACCVLSYAPSIAAGDPVIDNYRRMRVAFQRRAFRAK